MPTAFTETPRDLAFLLSEAPGKRSRDSIIVASGSGKLKAGTILGMITAGAITTAAKAGGNTGNGTISAPTALTGVKAGVYKLRFTAATTWSLLDPDGNTVGTGVNGTASDNKLALTTTAGGTAFVAGDGFDITVAAGSQKYVPSPAALTAGKVGAEVAAAILGYEIDATDADVTTVGITTDAEVKKPMLVADASVNDAPKLAAKIAQLRAIGIKAR